MAKRHNLPTSTILASWPGVGFVAASPRIRTRESETLHEVVVVRSLQDGKDSRMVCGLQSQVSEKRYANGVSEVDEVKKVLEC